MNTLRGVLRSPAGRVLTSLFIAVLVLVFAVDTAKTFQVISVYGVETGTLFWLVTVLKLASSIIAIVCLLLTFWFWSWSMLAWASLVSIIAIVGLLLGLKPEFLARWDVVLPYVLLAVSLFFKRPFRLRGHATRDD